MIITFEVDGSRAVYMLTRIGKRAGDFRPIAKKLDTQFVGFEKRLFESQGATGASGAWNEIKFPTMVRKIQKNQDTRILHATWKLRESLTHKSNPDHILEATKDQIRLGTKNPKAKFHHRARKPERQRKVIDLTERQRRAMVRTFQRYVLDGDQ